MVGGSPRLLLHPHFASPNFGNEISTEKEQRIRRALNDPEMWPRFRRGSFRLSVPGANCAGVHFEFDVDGRTHANDCKRGEASLVPFANHIIAYNCLLWLRGQVETLVPRTLHGPSSFENCALHGGFFEVSLSQLAGVLEATCHDLTCDWLATWSVSCGSHHYAAG